MTAAGEGDGAHPLTDRSQQHLAAGDRGEHQVAGVAGLQRDRAPVAPAAQAEGHGGDGDEADHCRAAFDDVGELARRRRLVGDEIAQPHHGEPAEQGGEVDAIGDLEPFQLAEATRSAGCAASRAAPSTRWSLAGDANGVVDARPYLAAMSVEAMQVFTAMLALAAAALAVFVVVGRLLRGRAGLLDEAAAR